MALSTPLGGFEAAIQPYIQSTAKLTTIDLIGGIKCHLCHITFGNKKDFDSHYLNHNLGSPNIVYTCVVCHIEITGYPSFRNHCYLKHVIKDRFKCNDCSKTFSKHSILKQHIATVHTFKCASCNKQFSSKRELQMHQITHKSESPPYDCQTCKKPILTVDDCEDHIDQHCSITYSCPICNETIPDKNEAVDHLTKHFGSVETDEVPIESPESNIEITEESSIDLLGGILCCFCAAIHKTRAEFETHFAEYHPDNDIIYSCNICGKQYDKYHLFGDHCYYHYSKNRFECESCDKSFSRLSQLVLHTEVFHSERAHADAAAGKPLSCGHCDRTYASELRLREHLRGQHGSPAVRCPHRGCGQIFDTPKDLIYHQAVHKSGNRCQQCGLQFTSLSACERHIPVHRKKQYSCPVCTRSYGEKYLTMKHIQQHFSSVLHLCKVCGKIFNAKNRLVEHLKVHSEVKNFKCTYCDKGFVKHHHLTQHMNIHTGMKPFQCTMCPKTFASYPNYHKHMRRIHKVSEVAKNNKVKNDIRKTQNNNNLVKEDFVDSTSSEMDMYSIMGESDESYVGSDAIDQAVMEQESITFEATRSVEANIESTDASLSDEQAINDVDTLSQFVELLPVDSHDAFVAAVTATPFTPLPPQGPPQEYGPDFGKDSTGFIDLDDQILPHIDPLLTIKPYVQDFNNFAYENYEQTSDPSDFAKWEPIISKVYSEAYGYEADARMSVLNTDIF